MTVARIILVGVGASGLCLASLRASVAPAEGVLVVTSSKVEAYGQALEGLQEILSRSPLTVGVVDLDAIGSGDGLLRAVARTNPRLIVTLGSSAARAATSPTAGSVPVLSTMILGADAPGGTDGEAGSPRILARLHLDVPLTALLAELKQFFPGRSRLGVIRNPKRRGASVTDLEGQASESGFSVR